MIPDLAPYTTEVLGAYGAALGLLGVLVGAVLLRARRVRRQLDEMEHRRGK